MLRRRIKVRHQPAEEVSHIYVCTKSRVSTYDLKVTSHGVITSTDFEVSTSKDVDGNGGEAEDASKDGVGLEREDEVCNESKAPDDKVESNGVVVVGAGGTFGSITSR